MRRCLTFLVLAAFALMCAACSSSDDTAARSTQPVAATTTTRPALAVEGWTRVSRPPNGGTADVQWLQGPNGQLAAVALPAADTEPFPVIVYFHGGSGLFDVQVDYIPKLAAAGYGVVAGCWNAGLPDGVQCPNVADPGVAVQALTALTANLPGADPQRLAAMGVSSGVGPAVAPDDRVHAIVADSGRTALALELGAPILVLSGKNDQINAAVEQWAADLQAAGNDVDNSFHPNGGHVVTLDPATSAAATKAVIAFLDDKLR